MCIALIPHFCIFNASSQVSSGLCTLPGAFTSQCSHAHLRWISAMTKGWEILFDCLRDYRSSKGPLSNQSLAVPPVGRFLCRLSSSCAIVGILTRHSTPRKRLALSHRLSDLLTTGTSRLIFHIIAISSYIDVHLVDMIP